MKLLKENIHSSKPILINFITVKFHICMYIGSDIFYETQGANNDTLLSGNSSQYSIQPLTGLSSLITLFFFWEMNKTYAVFPRTVDVTNTELPRDSDSVVVLCHMVWVLCEVSSNCVIFTYILSNQWLHLVLIVVSSECYSLIWGSRPPKHAVEKIIRMCLVRFICAHSWFLQ